MKLFPASASLDPLMRAVISAFPAASHAPLSRPEERRRDAFGALCDQLARDGFEQVDTVAQKWLQDERRREHVLALAYVAISGDMAEINRTKNWVADEFVNDCGDQYEEDARIKRAELADAEAEQAANEVWR